MRRERKEMEGGKEYFVSEKSFSCFQNFIYVLFVCIDECIPFLQMTAILPTEVRREKWSHFLHWSLNCTPIY
jgi:hypothetical protein